MVNSYSRNKFSWTSASVWEVGVAVGSSVGTTIDSKSSFAASFPATSEYLDNSFAQLCCCSVDTELIDGNNRAKNQFNGFFTTVEVNRLISLFCVRNQETCQQPCVMSWRWQLFLQTWLKTVGLFDPDEVCAYRGQTVYCTTELYLSVDKRKKTTNKGGTMLVYNVYVMYSLSHVKTERTYMLCFLLLLFPGRWWHEIWSDRFRQSWASFFQQFCPNLRLVYQNMLRTISSLIQVPEMTNVPARICEHNS